MNRPCCLLCRSAGAHATIAAAMTAALFALAAPGASAPQQTPPPPGSRCQTEDHRAFDFWLGWWVVTNPAGQQVGTNELTQIASGCAMLENWTSAGGAPGTSINYYDAGDGQWHQLWTGSDGMILHLGGGLVDGAMVLLVEGRGRPGPSAVGDLDRRGKDLAGVVQRVVRTGGVSPRDVHR